MQIMAFFFFYSWNKYAKFFHNFWGFPFGKKRPSAADRGCEISEYISKGSKLDDKF